MSRAHLGVLVGLASEARILSPHLPAGSAIKLSGARLKGAEQATEALIAGGTTALLSFGLAGGLAPGLPPGTLLLPDRVIDASGIAYPTDESWHERASLALVEFQPVTQPIFGSDIPLATLTDKQSWHRRSGAVAVDMESHVLARAARRAGLPLLIIRAIADPAERTLPGAALVGVRPDGRSDILAVLSALLRSPGQLPALIRLGRDAGAATRSLLGGARRGGFDGFGMG